MPDSQKQAKCFEIYLEKNIDWEGYFVFDIHKNGEHFDYIVKNKKTGKFHFTPECTFDASDMEVVTQFIDSKLQTAPRLFEQS